MRRFTPKVADLRPWERITLVTPAKNESLSPEKSNISLIPRASWEWASAKSLPSTGDSYPSFALVSYGMRVRLIAVKCSEEGGHPGTAQGALVWLCFLDIMACWTVW